jgi:hypothetical protein
LNFRKTGGDGGFIRLPITPSVICEVNAEPLSGVSDRNPDSLTRRPGPMTRKQKRRSRVVEFGKGAREVRIYIINRKDGYPEVTLASKKGTGFLIYR